MSLVATITAQMKDWQLRETEKWWRKFPWMRQAKNFIEKTSSRITNYLLNRYQGMLRMILGHSIQRAYKHRSNRRL